MVRGTGYLFILALFLAACSNTSPPDPTSAPVPTPSSTDAVITATTTPASTTTTTAVAPPDTTVNVPEPANTTDDHLRNMREIQDFLEYLGEVNPDPSLVALVIDPECSCYEFWTEIFGDLAANDWRYDPSVKSTIVDVSVFNTVDDVVEIGVIIRSPEDRILDADGAVVETFAAADDRTSSMLLRKDDMGRWRILRVTAVEI